MAPHRTLPLLPRSPTSMVLLGPSKARGFGIAVAESQTPGIRRTIAEARPSDSQSLELDPSHADAPRELAADTWMEVAQS